MDPTSEALKRIRANGIDLTIIIGSPDADEGDVALKNGVDTGEEDEGDEGPDMSSGPDDKTSDLAPGNPTADQKMNDANSGVVGPEMNADKFKSITGDSMPDGIPASPKSLMDRVKMGMMKKVAKK